MDSPSLSYLLAHPAALGFGLRHPFALLLLLGLPLVLRWTYPTGRLASVLRAVAYLALVLALAGLELTTPMPDERITLVAALDASPSIDANGRDWARRYVDDVQAALAPEDELAVITFGSEVRLLRAPGSPAPLEQTPPAMEGAVTDLASAIDAAAALLPAEGRRQILLLTDGNETRGHSEDRLPWLRTSGIRVDAAVPPRREGTDVSIDHVVAPPLVGEDSVSQIGIVAHNDGPLRSAVLNLYLDDRMIDSAAVELPPGRAALMMPAQLRGEGSYRLRTELVVDDDPQVANNSRDVGITIRQRSRALVITPRRESAVARALERKQLQVDVQAPSVARSDQDLAPYHVVVLEDVGPGHLAAHTLEVLERWVRERGGGLVVSGGTSSLGDGRFAQTPLRRLLPIRLEPVRPKKAERQPLALFLVIDRSNSMKMNSRYNKPPDGEKMRYAKEAALAVVSQLKDRDFVGLIAFDSKPYEIASLAPLSKNRRILEERIPLLDPDMGTDFFEALQIAEQQLAASPIKQRHIILLTDGDTNNAKVSRYQPLIASLAGHGVSVTTIRVGDDRINLELLQRISQQTGGEFHHVLDATSLPGLMLRETARALEPAAMATEVFYPRVAQQTQLLRGIDEASLPPVNGYARATLKDGADAILRVSRDNRQEPLLAVWHYGLGRVAVFAASPANDAARWVGWSEFAKFWSQVAHWAAREHGDDEVAIDVSRHDGAAELRVRTFGPTADGAALVARLDVDGTPREVALVPRQPRLFAGNLFDLPPGRYPLTIVKRGADGVVSEHTEPVTIPSTTAEDRAEFERNAPNTSLLTQLTEATGGRLDAEPRELAQRAAGERRIGYPLDFVLLPLAMLLFLGDTAVRRLGHWAATRRPAVA